MPQLNSSDKTALLAAVGDVQDKVAALATSWSDLLAAYDDARVFANGAPSGVGQGSYLRPGLRLDDILPLSQLQLLVRCRLQAASGMDWLADGLSSSDAVSDIEARVTTILSAY